MILPKRSFSGIQPTGNLHLGNYLGAIKQWVKLQQQVNGIYCIVDLHAITMPQDPVALRRNVLTAANFYLAAGLDPARSTIFVQSAVSAHSELAWILGCVARYGELARMTQFKDKGEGRESVSVGLFTYPVLMAADILLYDADVVPVGEDQKQHVELCRDVAERFNATFGDTFVLPEPLILGTGGRIMGLDQPSKKMSKSAGSPNNYIALEDDPDTITRKIKTAVTDPGSEVRYDPENKPGISNLLTIYSLLADEPMAVLEAKYAGKGYGLFKRELTEVVVENLRPMQVRYHDFQKDPVVAIGVLRRGADRAEEIAGATLSRAREKLGLGAV